MSKDKIIQVKITQEGSFWDVRELVHHPYEMDFMTMTLELKFANAKACDTWVGIMDYFILKSDQAIKKMYLK